MSASFVARALAVAVALGAAAMLIVTRWRHDPPAGAAASQAGRRFAWPAGSVDRYHVRWEGASRRTGLGIGEEGAISGRALFDGDVAVRSLGAAADGVTMLVYGLEQIRGYDLSVGAADLVGDSDRRLAAAALVGQEAFVRVDPRGEVRGIAYHKNTPSSTRELLRRIVDMMRVTLSVEPQAKSWTTREPTPSGLARVRYEDEGDVLRRTRLSYEGLPALGSLEEPEQRLSSRATIELSPKERVRSIDDKEELVVSGTEGSLESRWTFQARLADSGIFDVTSARAADLDEASGEGQAARERQRGLDEQLSQDWNLGTIEIELMLDGAGKHLDPKFVAEAAAFVRLHPESCSNLVAWFEDPRLNDLGRQLTLDVLSAAGSDEAQEAMRLALESKAVKLTPPLRGALVQRFIFVHHPNPESARFVADLYGRARAAGEAEVSFAAAATLGAIVDHMEGNDALAAEVDVRLRQDLAERRSPEESVALLRAVGNARQEADLPAVLSFADDAQPRVREQVARSLQRFDDPSASRALVRMAADAIPAVGRAALRSLREQALTDGDWQQLGRTIEEGRSSPYADEALVDLLERRPEAGSYAGPMLRFVLSRTAETDGTLDLRARIGQLLAADEAGPARREL